jgi:hypothetical protein
VFIDTDRDWGSEFVFLQTDPLRFMGVYPTYSVYDGKT